MRLIDAQWPTTHADAVRLAQRVIDCADYEPRVGAQHRYAAIDCDNSTRDVLERLIRARIGHAPLRMAPDLWAFYAVQATLRHRDALAIREGKPIEAIKPARPEPRQLSLFGGAL